jgi:FAD/FMN-containing dehydrogenase/Fe-S oxidoreductase
MDRDALRRDLEAHVDGEVRFDQVSRALYSTDASVYQIEPAGVLIPRSRDAVMRAVTICRSHGCPITMRGGGTSQAGQAIGDGLQIDTSKYLNQLLEVNPRERWARVEPGIVLDELNAALLPHGLRFAPDISTASRATVGGMMANNSSGARSVIYGKTIDHVLEQHVVLSDGSVVHFRDRSAADVDALCATDTLEGACYREVRRLADVHAGEIAGRYPKVLRRVGGYNLDAFVDPGVPFNLAKLMVGSEGTLGIVVEAKIALVALPKAKAVMAIQFHHLLDALESAPVILAHRPSAIEVMDRFILDNTKQSPALDRKRRTFIDGDPAALLCVEMYADDAADLPPRFDALERDLAARGLGDRCFRAMDGPTQATIWSLREAALGLSMAMRGDAKSLSFVEDTAVAPERLREYIDRFLALIAKHRTEAGVYAHASVGCLHVRPVINLKTAEGIRTFESLAAGVADLVLEFGGALSGEHGDGLVRSPFMEKMFGPVLYQAFRDVKRTFDPDGLFNPGKITDAPPLTANLRYGTSYRAASPITFFDYDEYGGIAGAVEMCSGLGACRKKLEGTMCPSYMATKEEKHSTRGRANALRLALSGRLGEAGLGDDGVKEVMSLCLECRACKAECPVGVDVARFKSEFLASYWERHGTPLRARMLGHVHDLSRWGSRFAPLSNVVAASAPVRWINERLAGIDARRKPPAWASRTFAERFRRECAAAAVNGRSPATPVGGSAAVVFNDTFTNYYNPAVGIAGVKVLRKAGCVASLASNVCCGRPLISQGLLAEARELAARNAETLAPAAESGAAIVFFEPSCLSAVREDAPALLRGEIARKARRVAESAVLFEEFADRIWPPDLAASAGPSTIFFHGHCHQKAMGMIAPAMRLLGRVPGAKVVDLDAGCCGMAGSFGYLRESFEVSRAIGERRLLPAARALPAGGVLVASGVSCRHQVEDFTGARALHPAELLHALIAKTS